ncbi:MAG: hemolysin family protein [Bacillota bacterium]|uniref:hemolysin family protein n=1 Tax=Virgibacillus TaxID=84406 RepID=UPI0019665164|nr:MULTISPECIES: hemolysin family protein [Virgibacillus]MCC2248789.1 hemolysin family protein [Virgibacillus sp. AGTR]MDY7045737.1 hemolysin family protein [Virgibacillus sp. M23]QRZ17922.1 HlyC/CorC family transporter [Virgibacillus sp. AGTR]WBX78753.1 hemolysin family protein [Virgibacillus salarius]
MEIVNLLLVAILIMLTAFFVATEFAIVKVRSTRIDHLIAEGNKKAIHAKKLIDNLDAYLSACQLGITVTALGLGWLGEPTLERILHPVFDSIGMNETIASIVSFAIAFLLITYLHVVIGELAPKTIAIQKAEAVTLYLARPLIFFYKIMYPFIWLLNGSARLFIQLFGFKPVKEHEIAHTEEELRLILSESYKSGKINQSEMMYVNNVFEFDEQLAKNIMTPRTEILCFYKDDSFDVNLEVIQEGQFTRYPVADGDKDTIIGLVNIKALFTGRLEEEKPISIEEFIRPILHVSEATPIKQLLLKMQKERIHMAIVNDEYGGTAGLITVEDILEEIVGEIRDEFDLHEKPMIENVDHKNKIVSGKLQLDEVNQLIGTNLEDEEIDTIGGWIFMKNLDATKGTIIDHEGFQFTVEEMDGYQIKEVRITKK